MTFKWLLLDLYSLESSVFRAVPAAGGQLSVVSMDDMERCLLVKQEVFVYKIPPRQSARGYRAADWNLSSPDWTGRLRIMEASKKVVVSF